MLPAQRGNLRGPAADRGANPGPGRRHACDSMLADQHGMVSYAARLANGASKLESIEHSLEYMTGGTWL